MSATVPDLAEDRLEANAAACRRPWPRLAITLGGSVFELRGATLFVRAFGTEIYVCTAERADWWTLREPDCFEAAAGRLRFSASKATAAHEP